MRQLPSRHRRLDGALADLPVEEPMLLSELDGFLTGILVCPAQIPSDEWMVNVWGVDDGGVPPFEDPLDVKWFVEAVTARQAEIARDLARRKPQPIFDIDERNGEVLWDYWIGGFAEAMALRPDAWPALAAGDDAAADALARLDTLIAIAGEESSLDSMEINAIAAQAPMALVEDVQRLHDACGRIAAAAGSGARPAGPTGKIGRNDPCPCGSGRKSKRCCGQAAA